MLQANQKGSALSATAWKGGSTSTACPAYLYGCVRETRQLYAGIPPHRHIDSRHRINVASRSSKTKLAEML